MWRDTGCERHYIPTRRDARSKKDEIIQFFLNIDRSVPAFPFNCLEFSCTLLHKGTSRHTPMEEKSPHHSMHPNGTDPPRDSTSHVDTPSNDLTGSGVDRSTRRLLSKMDRRSDHALRRSPPRMMWDERRSPQPTLTRAQAPFQRRRRVGFSCSRGGRTAAAVDRPTARSPMIHPRPGLAPPPPPVPGRRAERGWFDAPVRLGKSAESNTPR